jgi:hypothetical protein
LRHQIAGEPAGILDQDDFDAVAFDPVKQGREARPAFDRIGTRYGRIIEPLDYLISG